MRKVCNKTWENMRFLIRFIYLTGTKSRAISQTWQGVVFCRDRKPIYYVNEVNLIRRNKEKNNE